MNFIIENLKNSKTILIVSGLVAVIVFGALLVGYENYLRTLIGPAGEKAALYPDQSIAASYVISDHESWNLGNCCSSSPDISAGDYKNELALGYYCHNRDGEFTRLYRRITLRFDLSSLPDGASIYSAKLYLKPSKILYSQDASIYGASNDNWEEANCFDPKQMKPCPQSAAAFQPGALNLQDTVNINNTNWKNWNVTNFVYSKQNSGSKYVTLHLIGSAENLTVCNCDNCWDKRAVNFWGPRSSQKPYLLINYSGGETAPKCYTDADCQSGYKCQSGTCVKIEPTCGAGLTLCGEKCVNLNSDFYNCGYCGYKCSSGYKCQNGTCVKIAQCHADADCQSGYKCQNGTCVKEEPTCACGEWTAQTCGGGSCPDTDMHWTRTCAPSGCDSESKCWWDSICNASCEADGKCKIGCPNGDPDCSCSQQSGNVCQTNETCPGTSLKHSGSGICCSVSCAPAAVYYSISGKILKDNSGLSGITINLTGTSSTSITTDNYGNYSFSNLTDGSYTITPSNNNYIFAPISHTITIPKNCATTNIVNRNFNAISKECNSGETKNYTCPDGTEVDWCSCDNYKWACIDSPENNCPATCEADGKCKIGCPNGDPDCSCSQQSGNICQTNETCPGTSLKHSESGICCSIACEGSAVYQTADLNCDGSVNAGDMAIVLSWWDRNPSGFTCCQTPDIDSDGTANAGDYAIILSQWTFDTF